MDKTIAKINDREKKYYCNNKNKITPTNSSNTPHYFLNPPIEYSGGIQHATQT